MEYSQTGEESKMTEIFTGDIIRFGSDIVDKVLIFTCMLSDDFMPPFLEPPSHPEVHRNQDQAVRH